MSKDNVKVFFKSVLVILAKVYTVGKHILIPPSVKRKPFYWRWFVWLLYVFFYFIIFLGMIDINFLWLFGSSPSIADINNPKMKFASEVYSADGKLIGRFFNENRIPVTYEDLSPTLIKALITTEDVRFYNHFGVDLKATASIVWYMLKGDRRGGSTITQQLVKNLFKTRSDYSRGIFGDIPVLSTIIYKFKEWLNAFKIEIFYTKAEILTMYFNTVDFGHNTFGVKTAARVFFGVTPKVLNPQQCALLVGLLKAPTSYSPIINPERCRERTNTVLGQMFKYKAITKEEFLKWTQTPIDAHYKSDNNPETDTNFLRQAVQWWLRDWLKEKGYNLYTDGLVIHTTIESGMQDHAEEAVWGQMVVQQQLFDAHLHGQKPWVDSKNNEIPGFIERRAEYTPYYRTLAARYKNNKDSINYYMNIPKRMTVFTYKGEKDTTFSSMDSIRYYKSLMHAGFWAMDPTNGYVKAWVGDVDFKYFKFDNVRQSKRQPGSTFKAFLYAAAIDQGYSPCDSLRDEPVSITYTENGEEKVWAPHNASWTFSYHSMTLKYAFAKSVNSIAAKLTKEIGWGKVIEFAHKMGIKSKLENVPSVSLGSSDVTLYELLCGYATCVNGGLSIEPILVASVIDREGKVVGEFKPKFKRALSQETAFMVQQLLLAGLTEPGGTTSNLFTYNLFKHNTDIGGKTGTSQNHSDGWFVGVTPRLIGGSWVGWEDRAVHFRTSQLGEAARTSLPIFGRFLERVINDDRYASIRGRFPKPDFPITKHYQCRTPYIRKDTTEIDDLEPEPDILE